MESLALFVKCEKGVGISIVVTLPGEKKFAVENNWKESGFFNNPQVDEFVVVALSSLKELPSLRYVNEPLVSVQGFLRGKSVVGKLPFASLYLPSSDTPAVW